MKRFVWVDGRLAWPLVGGLLFIAQSLLVVDYIWRLLVLPFHRFVIYAISVDALTALVLISSYYLLVRPRLSHTESDREV
jgi:hypothetical protein